MIIQTFNGNTKRSVKTNDGVVSSFPLANLLPAIEKEIRIRDTEVVDGFVITDDNQVRVKIGRKASKKKSQ